MRYYSLCAAFTVWLFVLAANDREGIDDVGNGVARSGEAALEFGELFVRFVTSASGRTAGGAPASLLVGRQKQVEEGSVKLAAEQEAPVIVPVERRTIPSAVGCEGLELPCGIG